MITNTHLTISHPVKETAPSMIDCDTHNPYYATPILITQDNYACETHHESLTPITINTDQGSQTPQTVDNLQNHAVHIAPMLVHHQQGSPQNICSKLYLKSTGVGDTMTCAPTSHVQHHH